MNAAIVNLPGTGTAMTGLFGTRAMANPWNIKNHGCGAAGLRVNRLFGGVIL